MIWDPFNQSFWEGTRGLFWGGGGYASHLFYIQFVNFLALEPGVVHETEPPMLINPSAMVDPSSQQQMTHRACCTLPFHYIVTPAVLQGVHGFPFPYILTTAVWDNKHQQQLLFCIYIPLFFHDGSQGCLQVLNKCRPAQLQRGDCFQCLKSKERTPRELHI